jgi:hypothetical protein
MPTWGWWLLGLLVVALAAGVPLLVRRRRRRAWAAELSSTEADVAWFAHELIPQLRRTGSRTQAAAGWAVGSARAVATEDRLTLLQASAPSEETRKRARDLRDAVRKARATVDDLVVRTPDDNPGLELDAVADELEAALRPPESV